jgi:hypothetical protein
MRSVVLACVVGLVLAAPAAASARPARYEVGAAKADVTPTDLTNFYLGGYGIGPGHLATGVLRHIYFRVIAVRDASGNQAVIGALDSQGYSVAYQNGPFGFADIEQDIQTRLGIPAGHVILQATHSHNGPDEIGVWGGVPDSYYAFVKAQIESAITHAVEAEQPAVLRWSATNMFGFSGTFGSNTDDSNTGDNVDYPMDNQLRVLQAVGRPTASDPSGVIATLLNYSTHA